MSKPEIEVQNLDHLGIVAGIVDQLGIVEFINENLGTHPKEKVNAGVVVKAMILNGLGLVTAPLYMFEKFFVGIPTMIEDLLTEKFGTLDPELAATIPALLTMEKRDCLRLLLNSSRAELLALSQD